MGGHPNSRERVVLCSWTSPPSGPAPRPDQPRGHCVMHVRDEGEPEERDGQRRRRKDGDDGEIVDLRSSVTLAVNFPASCRVAERESLNLGAFKAN